MKFTCEKALLQSAVSVASRTVSQKSTIAALEGILIRASGTNLDLTGYNLATGIRTSIPADVVEAGTLVLSAHLFGDIVRRLPDEIISFSSEGLTVRIQCGKSRFSIMATDPEEYPDLPAVELNHEFLLKRATLRNMINQTLFSVSTNESRPIHTGALFEVDENDKLTIVCVDGYRLALRREQGKTKTGKPGYSFVVPAAALSEAEKICGDSEDNVAITVGKHHVLFQADNTILVARQLDGEFLNYRNSVPTEFSVRMVSEKRALQSAVERVSLIITEHQKSPLHCLFGRDILSVEVSTALGTASDECPMTGDGGELEIGFNYRYLLDALRAAPADRVAVNLNTPITPCVITPADPEQDGFLYMVLPVRLRVDHDNG